MTHVEHKYTHLRRWQAKFRSVSLRLGYIGNTCWAFLFFPVTRGSSILPLFGLTSESSIKYHIWLGHLSNLLFVLHTVGFFIYWGMTDQMADVSLIQNFLFLFLFVVWLWLFNVDMWFSTMVVFFLLIVCFKSAQELEELYLGSQKFD